MNTLGNGSVECTTDELRHLEVEDLRLLEVDRVARIGDPRNFGSGDKTGRRLDHMGRSKLVFLPNDEQGWHLHLGELGAAGALRRRSAGLGRGGLVREICR